LLSLTLAGAIASRLYTGSLAHNPFPSRVALIGLSCLAIGMLLAPRSARRVLLLDHARAIAGGALVFLVSLPLIHLLQLDPTAWRLDLGVFVACAASLAWLLKHRPATRAA
jgi:hypothetical protein